MISHHDITIFERYADRIYRFVPAGDGAVRVERVGGEGVGGEGGDHAAGEADGG
jgi:hypothetical protein